MNRTVCNVVAFLNITTTTSLYYSYSAHILLGCFFSSCGLEKLPNIVTFFYFINLYNDFLRTGAIFLFVARALFSTQELTTVASLV